MATEWYWARGGQVNGPIPASELKALADSGRLTPEDLVWKEGMADWQPARNVKELFAAGGGELAGDAPPRYDQEPTSPYAPPRAPTGAGPMPPQGGPQYVNIPNYLSTAILVTLFCCLPLGIVSIINAAQVNGKLRAGDIEGARESSERAKKYAWISFGLGIVVIVMQIIVVIANEGP